MKKRMKDREWILKSGKMGKIKRKTANITM